MKKFSVLFFVLFYIPVTIRAQVSPPEEEINELLNRWHEAAARADYQQYFSALAPVSIYIGTDPTEHWTKPEFMKWSKPYFDQGKAWSFSILQRNIFLADHGDYAWFDELLETHMGICRGSGVLHKIDGDWKIKHYVLSITIPNEDIPEVVKLKKDFEENLILKIKQE